MGNLQAFTNIREQSRMLTHYVTGANSGKANSVVVSRRCFALAAIHSAG